MASTIDEEMLKDLRRGWCFGSEEFRQGLLEKFESFSPSLSLREEKTRRDLQRKRMKNPVTQHVLQACLKKANSAWLETSARLLSQLLILRSNKQCKILWNRSLDLTHFQSHPAEK